MSSERAARSELLQTVQAQEEKIKRYETRLRDLVVAYRTITKEKTTLEETVKALSASQATSGSEEEDSKELHTRTEALSQSLAALTEEKRQMEASYVADRKKLMKEQEEAVSVLKRELESAEIVRRELQREKSELASRVREQRLAAEHAEADQACVLRELQSLLTSERSAREQLEFEVEALRESLVAAQSAAADAATASNSIESQERRIRDLRNEVEQLRGRQNATEVPLEELQAELVALKAEHVVQLQRENERANEAELRLKEFTAQHEERVGSLEARLTDLSLELGSQERTRAADQSAIAKLRDRITQLDLENSELAANSGKKEEEKEEVRKKTAELMEVVKADLQEEESHRGCKEELQMLREEFERYKLKAQSVLLKQQSLGRGVSLLSKDDAERLQSQVVRLKERCRELQEELAAEERANKRAQAALRRSSEEATAAHNREMDAARQSAERRVTEVGEELTRLRNRTLALLAEKDEEIALLRAGAASRAQALRAAASMSALLRTEEPVTAAVTTCSLIHCRQERARLATENRQLRESGREADAELREVKSALREAEDRLSEAARFAARMREPSATTKSGALDLEYLKNVVLRFATTADINSKRTMLRAIAAVLHFSPGEVRRVEQFNATGWF